MPDPKAFELLTDLASLQRRHSGGFILLAADRSRAWAAHRSDEQIAVDPAAITELQTQNLIMLEAYAQSKPRGTQILGMTTKGWHLIPRA